MGLRRRRPIVCLLAAALLLALVALAALLFWPEPPPGSPDDWLRAAGLEPRYETVRRLRIRYVRVGSGPPVVLVHGLASSIYTWREVIPKLSPSFHVVALDLPGFGGSEIPRKLAPDELRGIVRDLAERLGIVRASYVGHSLGGAVATTLAFERPERVDRLVLVDSAGFNFAPGDRPFLLRVVGSPAGALLVRLPVRRRLVRLGLLQVFHDDDLVTPDRVDAYYAPLARPGGAFATRAVLASDAAPQIPFARIAAGVRAPTLVVWGAEDAWVPPSDADRFVEAIPGARKVVLPECGHMPSEERPRELARLVREFLAAR